MEATQRAGGSPEPSRHADGPVQIVFDPTRLRQADASLFDPLRYGERAQAVRGRGGRGAAWFVQGPFGDAVLRHYQRGGWMASVSRAAYLWQGERHVRSLREFAMLRLMAQRSLPVPAPIAACYRRQAWYYQAAILVQRVHQAESFAMRAASQGLHAPWAAVGAAIGRCHREGAHHADMNANNVLIDVADAVCLIDWDKGVIENAPGAWCSRVLARLQRSLRKECPRLPASEVAAGMQLLRTAHDQACRA